MKGEVNNFAIICIIYLGSLFYCHTIAKFIPKGKSRLLVILPIVCIFLSLPLPLSSIHFRGITSFFIAWLANFRLLLFAFGKGPLSSNKPIPFSQFIPIATLPINIHLIPSPLNLSKQKPNPQSLKRSTKFPTNHVLKVVLLALVIKVYDYTEYLHPNFVMTLYMLYVYFALEILLTVSSNVARVVAQVELEPHFDEPYFSTSLQDFWGYRWNLVMSSILRSSTYIPVRSILVRSILRKWATLLSVLATFMVSGVMHELLFYYIGRLKPTGEVTCFFLFHGVCLVIEIIVKKTLNDKWKLPSVVSRPLTLIFLMVTALWLFLPPFLRAKPDVKACKESIAFVEFIKHGRLVRPDDLSCPLS